MKKKIIIQSCWTCRYRQRKAQKEPCSDCVGISNKSGWRNRGWWQKPVMAYILAALIAAALLAAMLIEWTTANATGPSLDSAELTARQEEVHEAAELLRSLGVAEESDGIKALSVEWWRCEQLKSARYLGEYTVTGYDLWCAHCQGKWVGVTASGIPPVVGRTVAMCKDYPFGTQIYIEGLGIYTVEDRGVGPGHIDVACNSHAECYALTGRYKVWILS